MKYVPGAAAIWLAVSSSAHAQTANVATIAADAPIATSDRIHGIVALGGAFTPKYDGASSYQAGPFAMFGLGSVSAKLVNQNSPSKINGRRSGTVRSAGTRSALATPSRPV